MKKALKLLKTHYRQIFIVFIFFTLALPMGYMLGIKDPSFLYGVDVTTPLPSLQQQSFADKEFQSNFEKWWNSHFLMRKISLKMKNQIYDWMNFGKIHTGYNNSIIEGKDHYIFEKEYFSDNTPICTNLNISDLKKIKQLKDFLYKRDIGLYIVLAPNKVLTYKDKLPARYTYFYHNDCQYYDKIENYLLQNNIPAFNAQRLMAEIRKNEKYEPFSKTGTHWNFYGAGRTVQASLKKFGLAEISLKNIDTSNLPYFAERDIANLLNLPIEFKTDDKFPYPNFEKTDAIKGNIAVIGNSFSNEYVRILSEVTGIYDITHVENSPLSHKMASKVLTAKKIFLIYTSLPFQNPNDQLYKKIDTLLNSENPEFTFFNQDEAIQTSGLSGYENWGRWSDGKLATIRFSIGRLYNDKKIIFTINPFLTPKHTRQSVTISHRGEVLAQWNFEYGKNNPDTSLLISPDMLDNDGDLELKFEIQNPKSPKELGISGDARKIGIGFVSAKITDS